MNRRALLTAIAAIPFIGRVIPASAYEPPKRWTEIQRLRDLLLPGIRGGTCYDWRETGGTGFDADLLIQGDRLLVVMYDVPHQRRLVTGIITHDDFYKNETVLKAAFSPFLLKMRDIVLADDGPRYVGNIKMSEVKV